MFCNNFGKTTIFQLPPFWYLTLSDMASWDVTDSWGHLVHWCILSSWGLNPTSWYLQWAVAWRKMPKSGLGSMQGSSSTKSHLPPKVVFHHRSSSTKGRLPPKVVFHQKSSFTKGRLPPKVVFHWRVPSTKCRLPPNVAFRRRLSSTECRLPP